VATATQIILATLPLYLQNATWRSGVVLSVKVVILLFHWCCVVYQGCNFIYHSVLAVDDRHVAFCKYNGSVARIICVAVATLKR
jgi:hypothetical protein